MNKCGVTAKVVKKVDLTTVYYDIEMTEHVKDKNKFICYAQSSDSMTRLYACKNCGCFYFEE